MVLQRVFHYNLAVRTGDEKLHRTTRGSWEATNRRRACENETATRNNSWQENGPISVEIGEEFSSGSAAKDRGQVARYSK
jgi:hypothetical protein